MDGWRIPHPRCLSTTPFFLTATAAELSEPESFPHNFTAENGERRERLNVAREREEGHYQKLNFDSVASNRKEW